MPYIDKDSRSELYDALWKLVQELKKHPFEERLGRLNYIFTFLIGRCLPNDGREKTRYHHYNAMIGVLECCKLELYREVAKYEDKAKKKNGKV